jgi:hypothetical protein
MKWQLGVETECTKIIKALGIDVPLHPQQLAGEVIK